jgi:hypothetical protein
MTRSSSALPAVASLPTGRLDLLVRAALAADDEARTAWLAWRAVADLDVAPWNEVRMLGVIAGRIAALEPDAAIRPRVAGFRRKIWTLNQVRLQAVHRTVSQLVGAGIPVMLIKGSARVTLDPRVAHERFVGDVDALVPVERQADAARVLEAEGYGLDHVPWQRRLHATGAVAAHHAWSYRKGHAEIDLHTFSVPINRLRGDDDRLWASARPVTWRGIGLRVPSREHALVLAVVHGLRSSDAVPLADWTVDACRILDGGSLDWNLILAEARDRQLQAIVHAGLAYVSAVLRRPVPAAVLDRLASECDEPLLAELHAYSTSSIARTEPDVRRAFALAMRRFSRGVPLLSPSQAAVAPSVSFAAELAPGSDSAWVPVDLDRLDTDWLVVRVGLELPVTELRGECLLRILLPGLPVGSVPLAAGGADGPLWRQAFMFPFHRGFLAARSIERIGICLLRDGAPLVWPGRRVVRVDLLAARAGASPPATGVRP